MKLLTILFITLMLVACSSKTKIHLEDAEGQKIVIEHEQEEKE